MSSGDSMTGAVIRSLEERLQRLQGGRQDRSTLAADPTRITPSCCTWWARAPARLPGPAVAAPGRCGARPACARADLGAPWPRVGAAPRWGRAEFASRGGRR